LDFKTFHAYEIVLSECAKGFRKNRISSIEAFYKKKKLQSYSHMTSFSMVDSY